MGTKLIVIARETKSCTRDWIVYAKRPRGGDAVVEGDSRLIDGVCLRVKLLRVKQAIELGVVRRLFSGSTGRLVPGYLFPRLGL